MSALGQTSHHSFDYIIGGDQKPRRNADAERLRCSNIEGCSEFGRGLNREIRWFVAAQNTVNIGRRHPEYFILVGPIGHEAASLHKKIKRFGLNRPQAATPLSRIR